MESETENRTDIFMGLRRDAESSQHAWTALSGAMVRKCEERAKVKDEAVRGKIKLDTEREREDRL
jgi:hypothetical protein